MAARGGRRIGAGRPPKAEEERVKALALEAIINRYGNELEGFKSLLESGDPGLRRWVFEHAYGKPTEKVDMTTQGESINGYKVEVLRSYANAGAEN